MSYNDTSLSALTVRGTCCDRPTFYMTEVVQDHPLLVGITEGDKAGKHKKINQYRMFNLG